VHNVRSRYDIPAAQPPDPDNELLTRRGRRDFEPKRSWMKSQSAGKELVGETERFRDQLIKVGGDLWTAQ
jgi:hypothetical protein